MLFRKNVTAMRKSTVDNKSKSSKRVVKLIYLNFFKYLILAFSDTFIIKLPKIKISADWDEGFIDKKGF